MARLSEKQRTLRSIEAQMDGVDGVFCMQMLWHARKLRPFLKSKTAKNLIYAKMFLKGLHGRVSNMRRIPGNRKVPKRPSIPRLMDDPCWNRWKDHFHVTKDSFYKLLRKIIRDPVFRVFEE